MTDSIGCVLVRRDAEDAYTSFVRVHGPLLRRALVARYGVEVGRDAAADALLRAWEDWSKVSAMANPVGYLYRVGQSAARPSVRWRLRTRPLDFPREVAGEDGSVHTDLFDALGRLPTRQRVAVILVKSHGHTYAEAAEALGVSEAAVGNHVRRGIKSLRRHLGEDS